MSPTEAEEATSPERMLLEAEEERREAKLEGLAMASLERLPLRLEEVARLRWIEGYSQERAAARLNLTRKALRVAEKNARDLMIDWLAKEAA